MFDISLVSANQLLVMSHRALVPHWVLMWPCRPPPCRTTLGPPRSPMFWCTTSAPTSRGWRCWVSHTLLFVTHTYKCTQHANFHTTALIKKNCFVFANTHLSPWVVIRCVFVVYTPLCWIVVERVFKITSVSCQAVSISVCLAKYLKCS